MFEQVVEKYGDIVLCNVITDEPKLYIDTGESITRVRYKIPAIYENQRFLMNQGFVFVDRMLKVSINLSRVDIDKLPRIRLKVDLKEDVKDEVYNIAQNSFQVDRRFNVDYVCNEDTKKQILKGWVDRYDKYHVCFFKDIPVGFAALQKKADSYEVMLAAVDEKYRMTGAAVSLYASLVKYAKEQGVKKLEGWISSVNMAVMNLYTALGAAFSEPSDIFIKEIL